MQAERVEIKLTIDNKSYSTREHALTPSQLLELAEADPEEFDLAEIRDGEHIFDEDTVDEPLDLREHAKFITVRAERKTIHFMVDNEPYTTNKRRQTPNQILQLAGLDPANYFLKEVRRKKEISYKDEPNKPIRIRQNATFFSVYTGETTVS